MNEAPAASDLTIAHPHDVTPSRSADLTSPRFSDLQDAARRIVTTADLAEKCDLARMAAKAWFGRALSLGARSRASGMPDRPGRPARPELRAPRDMPKRTTGGLKGRIALLHALAHIELNAVDMTWDIVGRFTHVDMPMVFFDNWVQVGLEEAKHFGLLSDRLVELGSHYGEHPAHDGLWQASQATGHDLLARLAVVPLVLEARGLDVTPATVASLRSSGDEASARILDIIYRDEKRHVAFGAHWFRFLCQREGRPIEATFHELVRAHFRGSLKPPFNDKARSEAGLTPGFYKPLAGMG